MNADLNSTTDSLLSVPDDQFDTLFDHDGTISPAVTALAPPSVIGSETPEPASSPREGERKPAKKRKSWGQELPTPKTNLPPRKRAKTEDEKEQRRIERVLRNRAAAQSSRERKRKEVEGLEEEKEVIRQQNALLTTQLRRVEMENQELCKTITKMAAEMSVFRQMIHGDLPTSHEDSQVVSPTLSADLIPSIDSVPNLKQELADLDFALPPAQSTVDPREASFTSPSDSPKLDSTITTSEFPDSTQHPAEMLCDLQCRSGNPWARWSNCDNGFNRLFSPDPAIGGDFPLFEDGLSGLDGGHVVGGNPFTFDALVDFEPDQAFVDLGEDGANNNNNNNHHVDFRIAQPSTSTTNLPNQLAPTTTGLQPCFGAPAEGRDGPGIAADVWG
ncbi:MAG: hypothetical protein M1816_002429 [Peltula sp. TS41687]|nr:MAG: hypothetical protein M1816_002429 [Peltula sp. TS41687]